MPLLPPARIGSPGHYPTTKAVRWMGDAIPTCIVTQSRAVDIHGMADYAPPAPPQSAILRMLLEPISPIMALTLRALGTPGYPFGGRDATHVSAHMVSAGPDNPGGRSGLALLALAHRHAASRDPLQRNHRGDGGSDLTEDQRAPLCAQSG